MSDIVGHTSAERYWEGRWRDEAKRAAELEAECAQHVEEISRLQADIIQMRGWVATPDGMRDARVAELEAMVRASAKYLNDELSTLRAYVKELEDQHVKDGARVAELEGTLRNAGDALDEAMSYCDEAVHSTEQYIDSRSRLLRTLEISRAVLNAPTDAGAP